MKDPKTLTESDILAELAKELYLPEREPDDVDMHQLELLFKSERHRIRPVLDAKVKAGEYETLMVRNPATRKPIRVWRKAKPGS